MCDWNNDDVLTEILLHLPAKSLIRFKSVCRRWHDLISSHHFCHLHTLRHHKPEPSLLLCTRTSLQFFYFHPILNGGKLLVPCQFNNIIHPKILSSCNGLLLLQSRSNHHPRRDYYIYNPTTKQSRNIVLTTSDKYVDVHGLNLAFDPSKSLHYKIVCIRAASKKYSPSRHKQCCQIELYDSATCTWKVCMEPFLVDLRVKFGTGVHWNQVIHWDNYPLSHLYFDIGKNVIGNLPNAKIPWGEGNGGAAVHCQLEESNGYLHHFVIVSDQGDKSIAMFELEKDLLSVDIDTS